MLLEELADWLYCGRMTHRSRFLIINMNGIKVLGVMDEITNSRWLLTCFYDQLDTSKRQETWDLLAALIPPSQIPRLVVGDFNDQILFHDEEMGGKVKK